MTFVGKIFVILIMAFSLLFLGISTVVFSTHTDWKKATEEQKKKVSELSNANSALQDQLDAALKASEKSKADSAALVSQKETQISGLSDEIKRAQELINDLRSKVDVAQQNSQTAVTDAEERRKETELLREQKAAVEKVANDFKLQETELRDNIRDLERQNASMDANNKDLRDRVARFSQLLRSNGLSDDITTVKGLASPPPVQGVVGRVDAGNRRVEITIGSDDGLVPGHELYLMRLSPRPEYLGRVRVQSVAPDQAVGTVIGNTVQGKKIQEGDIVSSTIRPRS